MNAVNPAATGADMNDDKELDAAPEVPALSKLAKAGLWVLAGGIVAFVVWASFAPLDEGVPAQATVVLDTKRKAVQHINGGVIKEIFVKEGETVEKGQPLLRLGDMTVKANYEAIRQRYLGFRAVEARLLAELRGTPTIDWHPELRKEMNDPLIARHVQMQEQLFGTRRNAYTADLQAIQESIRGQEAAINTFRGVLESRQVQRGLLREQLANISELVKDGYAPRNQQMDLERQVAENAASITDLQGNIIRATQSVAELTQRYKLRQQEYRREIETQLAEVSREVQSDDGRYEVAAEDVARTVIKSPASGQVVGIQFQTVGGVVPPGQKIMDIVPEKETLLLEAKLPPHLIDAASRGRFVDVRFSAFAHSPQLVVQGEVMSISGDLLTETGPVAPGGFPSYYLARIQLTEDGFKGLGTHVIQAGMPAEVLIRTGERTVLTYILHPLTRRLAKSMTEQ